MDKTSRRTVLASTVSSLAALHVLPVRSVPNEASVLEYETMPDGRVRIKDGEHDTASPADRAAFAAQLEAIARRRQADVDRVKAARAKRLRKASRRAQSNG